MALQTVDQLLTSQRAALPVQVLAELFVVVTHMKALAVAEDTTDISVVQERLEDIEDTIRTS